MAASSLLSRSANMRKISCRFSKRHLKRRNSCTKIHKQFRKKRAPKFLKILAREPGLAEAFFEFISECETPEIDAIAVTAGPGLEPALWVGINFAKALALVWDKPLVAVNHMEGHILAALSHKRKPQREIFEIRDVTIAGSRASLFLAGTPNSF